MCDKPAAIDFLDFYATNADPLTVKDVCEGYDPGPPQVDGMCKPHYENSWKPCTKDWECGRPILHVYGNYIVPSRHYPDVKWAIYEVRVIASDCPNAKINNDFISPPLFMNTALWGDVTASYAVNGVWPAPNGIVNSIDVVAIQSKLALSVTASLGKPRGDVVGEYPPEVTLSPDLIVDIVDQKRVSRAGALQSFPYQSPLGPWPCPEACHGK